MAAEGKRKTSLGQGLTTLLGDLPAAAGDTATAEQTIPIELIRPNPMQPRTEFDETELRELADSVLRVGVIQPLVLRPDPEHPDGYMLVAGERRWRAAQMARLHELPAVIRNLSDSECLEIALIENIQRSDLNPIEEARAYRRLMDDFGHTQERLSEVMGKSRSFFANRLRLLSLPDDVQELVRSGRLSAGHARALGAASDPSSLARKVVNLRLSVRQTEELVKAAGHGQNGGGRQRRLKDANTRVLEAALSAALKTNVTISVGGKGGSGRVVVGFSDLDQLQELCNLLRRIGMESGR